MPDFDRALPWLGCSLAYRAYRTQFTRLNSQYWGGIPSELFAARFFADHDDAENLRVALGVTSDRWAKVGNSVKDYKIAFDHHRRWSNLLTLVLMASCFEGYLSAVSAMAVSSDPLLAPGFPKRLDGALLLKHKHAIAVDTTGIFKGEWSARFSSYEHLFGTVPKDFRAFEGELETMRRMRNRVAHQFGLEDGTMVPIRTLDPGRLSQARLTKWMGVIDRCVRSVDSHLTSQFIGDFDTIEIFHKWETDSNKLLTESGVNVTASQRNSWRGFIKFLGGYVGQSPGSDYGRSVSKYYAQL